MEPRIFIHLWKNQIEHLFARAALLWYTERAKLLVDNDHSGKYNIGKNHLINWCF